MAKLNVKNEKYQQLGEQVAACFEGAEGVYDFDDIDVEVSEYNEEMIVEVSRMYDHLPLNFAIMEKLAVVFGTKEYGVNNWSQRGCETCDYGSKYAHKFHVPKKV
jgi:hypothetical protein